MPETVTICEVGPRDGLQNESTVLSPAVRAELSNRLAGTGLRSVEAASFVRDDRVPAMAGAEELVVGLQRDHGTVYSGLVLNERGYDRAVAAGLEEVHYAFSCSESFAQRNQNSTVQTGVAVANRLVRRARADGVAITVTLMVAFGCPFEGRVPATQVLRLAEHVLCEPPDVVTLADTIGVATPTKVRELAVAVRAMDVAVGAHFHNTRNTGYANAMAAIDSGVSVLDASVGGAGGCPYAPRATGNIATEDLVYLLEGEGLRTGVQLEALIEVSGWLGSQLGKELPGLLARAGGFPA